MVNHCIHRKEETVLDGVVAAYGVVFLIVGIFLLVLAVCWIILPFALIGTKPLLRQLIAEVRRNNELLDQRLPAIRPPPR
jgi:hypothetical protein